MSLLEAEQGINRDKPARAMSSNAMGFKKSPTLLRWRTDSLSNEHFKRGSQLKRLFLACAARWLGTVVLAAATYAVLWHYSSKTAMVSRKKSEFNTLIIALSIALGLNIVSSLTHMVRELRWWLLSLYEWTPREADLILQSEDIGRLVQLGCMTRRHWVRAYVLVWLLLNVASQIALATLGLTYNVNSADKIQITNPGNVSVPDLSNIQTTKVLSSDSQALSAMRYTANSYGLVALAYGFGAPSDIPQPGALIDTDGAFIFLYPDYSCSFTFYEATPSNLSYYMMVATDRSVSTSATCQSWKVLRGGDGTQATIVIDDATNTTIAIPAINGAMQTTFMVNPDTDSGPTWSRVTAFEASTTSPWYYECNITVGPVTNAVHDVQKLGVNVTSLAAGAIALQGYGASTSGVSNRTVSQVQFQSYPAESYYGAVMNGNASSMGQMMAVFAVGVIATTAQANSDIIAPGLVPVKGIELDIDHWYYVHIILGLTVGLQLLFAVVSAVVASRVTVRDHSYLEISALLRPLMQRMGYAGTMSSEKRILTELGSDVRLSYVPASNGIYYIKVND